MTKLSNVLKKLKFPVGALAIFFLVMGLAVSAAARADGSVFTGADSMSAALLAMSVLAIVSGIATLSLKFEGKTEIAAIVVFFITLVLVIILIALNAVVLANVAI